MQSAISPQALWQRCRTWLLLLLIAGLTLSWLAFPYLIQGKQILAETGQGIKMEKMLQARTLSQFLSRRMVTPTLEEVNATFAVPEYFKFMDQVQAMARHRPEKYHVFFINENVHTGRLPQRVPKIGLVRPDNTNIAPVRVDAPTDVDHHRAVFVYFDKIAPDGRPTLPDNGEPFRLMVENTYETGESYLAWFEWTYPVALPEHLTNGNSFSLLAVLTLSIGLLSAVLTPLHVAVVRYISGDTCQFTSSGRAGLGP